MYRKILSAFLGLSFITGVCAAQVVEKVVEGLVDWQQRKIKVTGMGIPNKKLDKSLWEITARKAAEMDALARLLAVTKGINLNASYPVDSIMTTHQEVKRQVEGVLRNFEVIATRKNQDGSVEVDVTVPIDGPLANNFIPANLKQKPPLEVPPAERPEEQEKPFTGLIVYAQGLGVRPAMEPKIINEKGEEVYGEGYFLRENAISHGVSGYSRTLKEAKGDRRAGDNPLIVKGIRSSGPRNTDVVISDEEANRLHSTGSCLELMKLCKVIILID